MSRVQQREHASFWSTDSKKTKFFLIIPNSLTIFFTNTCLTFLLLIPNIYFSTPLKVPLWRSVSQRRGNTLKGFRGSGFSSAPPPRIASTVSNSGEHGGDGHHGVGAEPNPKPLTINPKPCTLTTKLQLPNPEPQTPTQNPRPQRPNQVRAEIQTGTKRLPLLEGQPDTVLPSFAPRQQVISLSPTLEYKYPYMYTYICVCI